MSYVEVRALSKAYDGNSVFKNIDLDVEQGQICVLVGPSGCGKTTLLRGIAGLTLPDSGVIRIDGRDVTRTVPKDRGVGMVFQHYALFPNMTVEQNLSFGLEQQKLPKGEVRKKVDSMIHLMGLEARAKARPATLSGGQKQRVALARALITEPKLLLLDEPLSALDAQIRKRLREELKRLQHQVGFTAIFVTHDQEEALMLGDVVAIMQNGRFVQVGTPAEIYNSPAGLEVASFIGDFNLLEPAQVKALFKTTTDATWAIRPESVVIAPASKGKPPRDGTLQLSGTVSSVQVLVAILRYYILSNGIMLKVDVLNTPEAQKFRVGDDVVLQIAPRSVSEMRK
ncbi:MAG: ABC transporter ATP-binding protein [Rhizobiales bacterium]|nr:ABC transporter ATP-binding protein [Hyphomicrobiales bacterium]